MTRGAEGTLRSVRVRPVLIALVALSACTQRTPAHWQRPEGSATYRFTSTEEGAGARQRMEVDVHVQTNPGQPEVLTLLDVRTAEDSAATMRMEMPAQCVREFGGGGGTIGRIEVSPDIDAIAAVPQCVPENLFGAVTDLISILLVQTPTFGIDSLDVAGDTARFSGFETGWSREQPQLEALAAAPGGTISLMDRSERRAVVHWTPDSMDLAIARRISDEQAVLMRGHETFSLELVIDPGDGSLISARALEDRLNLRMWMIQGSALPALSSEPAIPGTPLVIRRTLSFERLN